MNEDRSFRKAARLTLIYIGLLWWIFILDSVFHLHLVALGILPRQLTGLAGILYAPLVHGSWFHILANTPPLFVLGTAMIYGYPKAARIALPVIYLLSGVGVWFFGRTSYHVGSSGLAYGMIFFVFVIGLMRRDRLSLALALVVFFLYGGMIWGILPQQQGVSFEYHLFGSISGLLMAVLLRNYDTPLPEKKYDWEETDSELSDNEPDDGKEPSNLH